MFSRTRAAYNGRAGLIGSSVIVALVVIAAIVVFAWPKGNSDATTTHKPTPSASGTSSTTSAPSSDPALTGFVTLPAPTGDVEGLPAIYPHTPEGAVATWLMALQQSVTLDYSAAEHAQAVYEPSASNGAAIADKNVAELRKAAGVPASGAAPVGASLTPVVEGVMWRVKSPDLVAVSEQLTTTIVKADGSTALAPDATPWTLMKWSDGRWLSTKSDAGVGDDPTYAKPGTTAFTAAGWQVVKNSDWQTDGAVQ